jgi:hypothetical protein
MSIAASLVFLEGDRVFGLLRIYTLHFTFQPSFYSSGGLKSGVDSAKVQPCYGLRVPFEASKGLSTITIKNGGKWSETSA